MKQVVMCQNHPGVPAAPCNQRPGWLPVCKECQYYYGGMRGQEGYEAQKAQWDKSERTKREAS